MILAGDILLNLRLHVHRGISRNGYMMEDAVLYNC
jgi:hypothetical protein